MSRRELFHDLAVANASMFLMNHYGVNSRFILDRPPKQYSESDGILIVPPAKLNTTAEGGILIEIELNPKTLRRREKILKSHLSRIKLCETSGYVDHGTQLKNIVYLTTKSIGRGVAQSWSKIAPNSYRNSISVIEYYDNDGNTLPQTSVIPIPEKGMGYFTPSTTPISS